MPDPLGLIPSTTGGISRQIQPPVRTGGGPGFKEMLAAQIEKANALQKDATEALEALAAGRRDDVERVLIATRKADTAFRILLQVRNKVMEAYDEVKRIRV